MKLKCDPNRPGDLYLNGELFASIHPGQAGLSDQPISKLNALAEELARRWNADLNAATHAGPDLNAPPRSTTIN